MPTETDHSLLAYIVCPFFQRESANKHNIVCEGADFLSNVCLNYGNNEKARQKHLKEYCCSMRYKECRVCKLISNAKYEEGG
jgi:hypothetical protein